MSSKSYNNTNISPHAREYLETKLSPIDEDRRGACDLIFCILNNVAKRKIRESRDIPEDIDFDFAVVRNGELKRWPKTKQREQDSDSWNKKPFCIYKHDTSKPLVYSLYRVTEDWKLEIIKQRISNKKSVSRLISKGFAYVAGPGEHLFTRKKDKDSKQKTQNWNS